jgi:nucleoside-triphosphatase THEP1
VLAPAGMQQNPWIAVVGTRQTGRSEITHVLAERLRQEGVRVIGFVSEPIERDGTTVGYDLVELPAGRRRRLAEVGPRPRLCRWVFDDALFVDAARQVSGGDAEVVILQVGTLEASGDGLWAAIEAALAAPARLVVLAIRPHLLVRVADRLPEPAAAIELPADDDEVARFVDRAIELTGSQRASAPICSTSDATSRSASPGSKSMC